MSKLRNAAPRSSIARGVGRGVDAGQNPRLFAAECLSGLVRKSNEGPAAIETLRALAGAALQKVNVRRAAGSQPEPRGPAPYRAFC